MPPSGWVCGLRSAAGGREGARVCVPRRGEGAGGAVCAHAASHRRRSARLPRPAPPLRLPDLTADDRTARPAATAAALGNELLRAAVTGQKRGGHKRAASGGTRLEDLERLRPDCPAAPPRPAQPRPLPPPSPPRTSSAVRIEAARPSLVTWPSTLVTRSRGRAPAEAQARVPIL